MKNEEKFLLQGRIPLPVEARSIFRLLAIGTVVRDKHFISYLSSSFDKILFDIKPTPRLMERAADFLGYQKVHDGGDCYDIESCGEEELCRSKYAFFGKPCDFIGTVFDYQVPLSSSRDAGEGVIDMISAINKNVYIIEAKKWNSNEHPLRALFEAITFWKMVINVTNEGEFTIDAPNGSCFLNAYINGHKEVYERLHEKVRMREDDLKELLSPDQTILKPAILISGCKDTDIVRAKKHGYGVFKQLMIDQLEPCYAILYGKILQQTGLRCFCYHLGDTKLTLEDFTDDLIRRLDVSSQ